MAIQSHSAEKNVIAFIESRYGLRYGVASVISDERVACFDLGKISCSLSVKAALDESGVNQDELVEFHQLRQVEDGAATTRTEADDAGWVCSSFELPKLGRTVWVVTDPQRLSTTLYLEEP